MDHKLVEFVAQAPPHLKLSVSSNKILLRKHLANLLPSKIAARKKKAFYIPTEQYFQKGPLSEIVKVCLSEESVRKRGYFKWESIRELQERVNSGDFLFAKQLFSLTVLELWHRIFIDRESGWDVGAMNLVGSSETR